MSDNSRSTIIKYSDIEGVETQFGSKVKMLMHPAFMDMHKDVSVLWVTLPPGTSTGRHNHPEETEIEYIVSGTGTLTIGEDNQVLDLEPWMVALNPPGLFHNVVNTSSEIMHLLRIHVPALPTGVHGDLRDRCIQAAKKSLNKHD